MSVSADDARRVGNDLDINWAVVPVETFRGALATELEHADVTQGDLLTTGRIALAHFREDPDYYTRLSRAEVEAEKYWAARDKPSPTLGGAAPALAAIVAGVVLVLVLVIVAAFAWRFWGARRAEDGFRTHVVPVPGDPNRNILRRSRPPGPAGRYPVGGLADFYFQYDPAYSSPFETDFCWLAPDACAGIALEPFRPSGVF